MELYNEIFKRKSIRKYNQDKLDNNFLEEMDQAIDSFDRLYDDLKLDYRIVENTKGRFTIDAPHNLIISGQGDSRDQEAAGFLYEQLILWLSFKGIGCVWQGNAKEVNSEYENDLITIAFGKSSLDTIYRSKHEFKRKKINDITNDVNSEIMEAVRVAPSGLNQQPWYFEKKNNSIYVYEKKLGLPLGAIYKLTKIDMGIALAHYMLGLKHNNKSFIFTKDNSFESKKGYIPFGIISID